MASRPLSLGWCFTLALFLVGAAGFGCGGDPQLPHPSTEPPDAALSKVVLDDVFPNSRLPTDANLLIMPSVDAANISYNLLKIAAGSGITVGPILLGTAKPVHILEPAVSVRRIVNMTALAVVDANPPR